MGQPVEEKVNRFNPGQVGGDARALAALEASGANSKGLGCETGRGRFYPQLFPRTAVNLQSL